MTNRFRKIKACIILSIFVFSAIAVFAPTSSAALFNSLEGQLRLNVKAITNRTVTPNSQPIEFELTVYYDIAGVGADVVYFPPNTKCQVDVIVSGIPDWATVEVNPSSVQINIDTFEPMKTTLLVYADERAPAQSPEDIEISLKAHEVRGLGAAVGESTYGPQRVSFVPAYLPILSYNVIGGTYQQIGPMDTAEFEIELENLANGKTEVQFTIEGLPDGWTASVPNLKTLGSSAFGDEAKSIVTLSVQPPKGFGYHFEKETLQLNLKAKYYGKTGAQEEDYPLDVTVESRGISTVGIEIPIIIILLIVFIVVAVIFFMKKYKQ